MDHTDCDCGKRGYPSRATCKSAHKMSGARLRFYRCPISRDWHATNDQKNQKIQNHLRKCPRRLKPSRRWKALVADPHRGVA